LPERTTCSGPQTATDSSRRTAPRYGSPCRDGSTGADRRVRTEGDGEPVRHRLSRGGNRRVNACLYRIAITQLRCDPRARKIYDNARQRGHTKKEAMRILKRHLSDVVYRRMMRDLNTRLAAQLPDLRVAS
jgi:Transposase IS116/IS110/IS902 family